VNADRLVWVDCEMTGLDPRTDALIEIAVLVTDFDLTVLGDGVDLVIRPPDATLTTMSETVRTMHTESGLLDRLADGTSVQQAEKAPLAGNSVHVDRGFLARDMPRFESALHYRNVDVSTVKELSRRWFPRAYYASPEKTGNHRALGDIEDSIRELRYYRRTVFVPGPGPETDVARKAAAEVAAPAPGTT
jgi:oligoribonuclease